ncbi:hypothetical protein [Putridiphycobacter roseus]|nr:hypothetical protein [Putridiphycobacter roseus]
MYFKKPKSYLLLFYAIGITLIASSHQLTLATIKQFLNLLSFEPKNLPMELKMGGIVVYFVVLAWINLFILKKIKVLGVLNYILLAVSFTGILMNDTLFQAGGLSLFMLFSILGINFSKAKQPIVVELIGYQFLLFLFLENIRLFTS